MLQLRKKLFEIAENLQERNCVESKTSIASFENSIQIHIVPVALSDFDIQLQGVLKLIQVQEKHSL